VLHAQEVGGGCSLTFSNHAIPACPQAQLPAHLLSQVQRVMQRLLICTAEHLLLGQILSQCVALLPAKPQPQPLTG
jgi:hypothetical protein